MNLLKPNRIANYPSFSRKRRNFNPKHHKKCAIKPNDGRTSKVTNFDFWLFFGIEFDFSFSQKTRDTMTQT